MEVLVSGAVDVTWGCQNGATARARWHDGAVVDLERIAAEITAYYRALEESATLRRHFRHVDEEGGLWYIEAVPDRGELIVIKQAELTAAGQLHRYCWEHLEDEHGGLTDQAIDPEQDPLEAIPVEEFQRVWTR
jgi:CRISPR/Cas system CMR subunit Cmr4 (Cas7 group RAMP superfamily)